MRMTYEGTKNLANRVRQQKRLSFYIQDGKGKNNKQLPEQRKM